MRITELITEILKKTTDIIWPCQEHVGKRTTWTSSGMGAARAKKERKIQNQGKNEL